MSAPSIWHSAHATSPEDARDAFLKNPRGKDGKLYLQPKNPAASEEQAIWDHCWKD